MSERLTFVCWRWRSPVGYRSTFTPETVYALREMIRRHYSKPHRFLCVTDHPSELKGVETVLLWEEGRSIPSPFGAHNPSCYVRLKVFAPDAGKIFGERLVSIDLDTVIVDNIEPLFDTDVDFKIWGETALDRKRWGEKGKQWHNGSLYLLRTGSLPHVWTTFDPETSPEKTKRAGFYGSDQGWLSHVLGPHVPTWGREDGVFSFRKHIAPFGEALPPHAKIVFFHGKVDPWHQRASHFKWIREHYPIYHESWAGAG